MVKAESGKSLGAWEATEGEPLVIHDIVECNGIHNGNQFMVST